VRVLERPLDGTAQRAPSPGNGVIRIVLVERRSLFRDALATVLSTEEGCEVSAALAHLDQAVAVAAALRPDVVVIDLDRLEHPAAAVGRLIGASPGSAVLVLADPGAPDALRVALDSRVRGLVNKDVAPGRLAGAIRRVGVGERVIDPNLAVAALCLPPCPLTDRERDVLRVAEPGLPADEIADRLRLSVGTVRSYVSRIMRKTGARNRAEAVRIARDRGWL
jgi:two-component system, NarL family, response regulator DesR